VLPKLRHYTFRHVLQSVRVAIPICQLYLESQIRLSFGFVLQSGQSSNSTLSSAKCDVYSDVTVDQGTVLPVKQEIEAVLLAML
jgi:hypothetical protein